MNECELCERLADQFHALCDSCDEQLLEWDEKTDTYIMKDGRRFTFIKGYYVLTKGAATYERNT